MSQRNKSIINELISSFEVYSKCNDTIDFDELFASIDSKLSILIHENEFIDNIIMNDDYLQNKPFLSLLLLNTILRKLMTLSDDCLNIWFVNTLTNDSRSVLSHIFQLLPQCEPQMNLPLMVVINQKEMSIYDSICYNICCFILRLTSERMSILEQLLLENLLSDHIYMSLLSSDVWYFIIRIGSSEMCLKHCLTLTQICVQCDDFRFTSAMTLLDQILPFLEYEHKLLFIETFTPLSNPRIYCHLDLSCHMLLCDPISDMIIAAINSINHNDKVPVDHLRIVTKMIAYDEIFTEESIKNICISSTQILLGLSLNETDDRITIAFLEFFIIIFSVISDEILTEIFEKFQYIKNLFNNPVYALTCIKLIHCISTRKFQIRLYENKFYDTLKFLFIGLMNKRQHFLIRSLSLISFIQWCLRSNILTDYKLTNLIQELCKNPLMKATIKLGLIQIKENNCLLSKNSIMEYVQNWGANLDLIENVEALDIQSKNLMGKCDESDENESFNRNNKRLLKAMSEIRSGITKLKRQKVPLCEPFREEIIAIHSDISKIIENM